MSFTPAPHTPTGQPAPVSHRWLKSHELLYLLSNPASYNLCFSPHPPLLPPVSGSLLLYNKSHCRRWRLDHRAWRMPERHVKLKVKGVERMNAIYAQQEDGAMCRRGYWLLDRKDVVLVHYVSKQGGEAAEGEGEGEEQKDTVKAEAEERKEAEVEAMTDAPYWLQSHEETKQPPLPPLSPLLPAHSLSVNASDSFLSPLSSSASLLSPAFHSSHASSSLHLPPLPSDELLSPSATAASASASASPAVLDVAPGWDYASGGAKLLLCCSFGHLFDPHALHALFDQQPVRVQPVAGGTYRLVVPPLAASHHSSDAGRSVAVSIVLTDGRVSTPAVDFEYRYSQAASTAAAALPHASFPLPTLTHSPLLPSRTPSQLHAAGSLSACSTPRLFSTGQSSRVALPTGRELLSSLLSLLMSIERHLLLSAAAATVSFLSTWTLEDIQRLVQAHPSDDLLEGMLLSILHSLVPPTHSAASSALHSPVASAHTPVAFSFPPTSPPLLRLLTLSDVQGRQLVHLCASLGYLHLLAFLLDAGVSIHTPTDSSAAYTPLHLAVIGGEEEVVRAVLAMGGEEGRLDGQGRSAVELARRLGRQRLVEVFRLVQEEEERESRWQWEEADEDEEDDAAAGGSFKAEQFLQPPLQLSTAFTPTSSAPMSPSASLSPLASYLSVSTIPPPLLAAGSGAPSSSATSDAGVSSSFSRLTLSDIGIDTSELSLHLQSLHPQPASFASFVSHTLTHVRSWLYRRHYAALTLQAAARGMLVRRRQKRLRESAVVIQQAVRRRKERQAGGGRFHHLVQDMQERVRRKREEMEREAGGGGERAADSSGGAVGGSEMDTGSRAVSPVLGGVGGGVEAGAVEHLSPLSPLAASGGALLQHWSE